MKLCECMERVRLSTAYSRWLFFWWWGGGWKDNGNPFMLSCTEYFATGDSKILTSWLCSTSLRPELSVAVVIHPHVGCVGFCAPFIQSREGWGVSSGGGHNGGEEKVSLRHETRPCIPPDWLTVFVRARPASEMRCKTGALTVPPVGHLNVSALKLGREMCTTLFTFLESGSLRSGQKAGSSASRSKHASYEKKNVQTGVTEKNKQHGPLTFIM